MAVAPKALVSLALTAVGLGAGVSDAVAHPGLRDRNGCHTRADGSDLHCELSEAASTANAVLAAKRVLARGAIRARLKVDPESAELRTVVVTRAGTPSRLPSLSFGGGSGLTFLEVIDESPFGGAWTRLAVVFGGGVTWPVWDHSDLGFALASNSTSFPFHREGDHAWPGADPGVPDDSVESAGERDLNMVSAELVFRTWLREEALAVGVALGAQYPVGAPGYWFPLPTVGLELRGSPFPKIGAARFDIVGSVTTNPGVLPEFAISTARLGLEVTVPLAVRR